MAGVLHSAGGHTGVATLKLIVQVPCYNEAANLPAVLASIPRQVPGVDSVHVVVVDDGSNDGTSEVARAHGADTVLRHSANRGLAAAFRSGLDRALRMGADVIVNTDGDNQYPQEQIPELIRPILAGEADLVIGDRRPASLRHFSPIKRMLQLVGSRVVSAASGAAVADAPSGFRAFSREAALQMNVLSGYSYTLETLIQAGAAHLRVVSVPIAARPSDRPSRLMRSIPHYLLQSGATVTRAYATYRPLAIFLTVGLALISIGAVGIARFLYYYVTEGGAGHVQSLVLAATLVVVGFQVLLIGLVADLVAANRRLVEEALVRLRRLEADRERGPESNPGPSPNGMQEDRPRDEAVEQTSPPHSLGQGRREGVSSMDHA
jgi:hypothetical protein